jgi:hypothetical protein
VFDLGTAETDLLLAVALVEASPEAARLADLLTGQAAPSHLSIASATNLGHEPATMLKWLKPDAPLVDFGLLTLTGNGPMVSRQLGMPPHTIGAILGIHGLEDFIPARLPTKSINLPDAIAERVKTITKHLLLIDKSSSKNVFIVTGDVDSGRHDVARALASAVFRHAITADFKHLDSPETSRALRRSVALADVALILTITGDDTLNPHWPDCIRKLAGPIFVVAEPGQYPKLASGLDRPVVLIELPKRTTKQRAEYWHELAPTLPQDTTTHVAERSDVGRSGVNRALGMATLNAKTAGRGLPEQADIVDACDHLRRVEFEGAAERLACPFERDDIVLRDDTSSELDLAISWARHGSRLFSQDGEAAQLNTGEGLACLFFGPPGTGKTMAAQVVAKEIDYALYRIDLSQVFDKFIGESEKRLGALFDEAERSRVALFFDEADSCFGKRTDVRDSHDRYANMGTNFLLQRLECFSGLAILATNFVSNMDDAFVRRLRVRAEFAAPGAEERRKIWDRLLPIAKIRSDDIDLSILADPFEIVGGEIRNAIYTAHLLAASEGAPLSMTHCVRGLWRELEKIGRLSERAHLGHWKDVV